MNYESERAMNQKRLRMEGDHGVVQANGLPLNYMGGQSLHTNNGHQIPYQPYGGAYNTHYPPPEAFPGYAPPPGGYAPQNLSYAPPAHQNYAHHQSFAHQQQPLHIAQPHMVQGYGAASEVHKWPPQHLLPPHTEHKQEVKMAAKPEIKLEPAENAHKRPNPLQHDILGELEQPKIKIKTDIFKPDDTVPPAPEPIIETQTQPETLKPTETRTDEIGKPESRLEDSSAEKPPEALKTEQPLEEASKEATRPVDTSSDPKPKPFASGSDSEENSKASNDSFFSNKSSTQSTPGQEAKKRGRPKGSTNKPKPAGGTPILKPNTPNAPAPLRASTAAAATPPHRLGIGRPRGTGYQYAIRPFRKDFSGIQFRRRWSDDCLDSSHIPNEVYFGDVPVSMEVLFNYYDAGAEREKQAAQQAHVAAQKAAAAKLAAAKLQARGLITNEVTTVDSSSSSDSSGSDDDSSSSDSDDDQPLKAKPGRPKGTPNKPGGTGRRGRPPVPPELREPGITEVKKWCKAAGIRFDYKKLVEGCTKNKERVAKMVELLEKAGLEGKPTLEKCRALKQAKVEAKETEKKNKLASKKSKEVARKGTAPDVPRRMTRGQTGTKPRQKIVISSEEEDDTPDARRALSKLRSSLADESASD